MILPETESDQSILGNSTSKLVAKVLELERKIDLLLQQKNYPSDETAVYGMITIKYKLSFVMCIMRVDEQGDLNNVIYVDIPELQLQKKKEYRKRKLPENGTNLTI